ncbi:MAG: alkaline phosphatase family protein [Planctomycetota bacterium]|jgi:hypothetical protein
MNRLNIMHEQWDYLIILDACRYDYFDRLYRNYFDGDLTKKISSGSCTNQWRDKSFPDCYDDIVYISANPQISANLPVYGYLAGDHFHKVHEVWKTGWDSQSGTVLPETLTNAAIDIITNTTADKRFIIHYLPPHAPYLMAEIEPHGYNIGDIHADRTIADSAKYERFSGIKKWLLKNLLKVFKDTNILTNYPEWVLRQVLHMAPMCAMDVFRRRYGAKMLPKAYEANLECVLRQVAVLIEHLAGTVVVTSDHGELLGEGRRYAHPYGSLDPNLIEVPWLTIEKAKRQIDTEEVTAAQKPHTEPTDKSETEQEELKRKLKSLGYYD